MSRCPSESTLRLIGTDLLGDATFAGVEAHVEGCRDCQAVVERLAKEGPGEMTPATGGPATGADVVPTIPGFDVERELGRGGMGVVYLARETRLDRPVAVKVVSGVTPADPRGRTRWLREARALARVRHDNVVEIYRVDETEGGLLFLVLEYVPGGTLAGRLEGPLPPRVAAGLTETIARTVAHFHERGLCHLDLKPSNILLDGAPGAPWDQISPRVSDFGIARLDGEPGATETASAGPRGTPSYMAPEQVTGRRDLIGPPADIHALGALLYHLLTGRPPFQGASTPETYDQVRHQDPVPPRRLNPKIHRDLETVCLTCLRKEPSRRYPTALALAGDLHRWLDGKPIQARPASPFGHAWRWCRRRPVVATLAGALALTFVAGFLITLLLWRRAEENFRTAEEVLSQIVDQTVPEANPVQVVNPESLIPALEQTRTRLLAVAARRHDHPVISRQLAFVDTALGFALMQQKRLDEARSHLDESLRCLESVLRHNPRDPAAWERQVAALTHFATLADDQKRPEESLGYQRRAVEAGEALVRLRPSARSICLLAGTRNGLAGVLARRGDHEQARSLMDANRRVFEHVPVEAETAEVVAYRVFAQLDFDRFRTGSAATVTPASWDGGSGHPDPLRKLASPDADRLPAQDWAELALQALRSAARPNLGPAHEPWPGHTLVIRLGNMAAEQRHCGRLDEARRTADRMLALGRLLVARHPGQPFAHLALSEAHIQLYKNAWQTDDLAAVERDMRLALDAALRAQLLDPNSELARLKVDGLQRRLKDLGASPS
jgi:tetratricopeptide (TPR) repeat protein